MRKFEKSLTPVASVFLLGDGTIPGIRVFY
jgi:hypothetical protein